MTVRGVETPFKFIVGTDPATGKKAHRVAGTMTGKSGKKVIINYTAPEDEYDEEAVVEMIEGIK